MSQMETGSTPRIILVSLRRCSLDLSLSLASPANPLAEPREHIPCPLCGTDKAQVVLLGRDRLFGLPGEYPIVACQGCSLRYVNPRPTMAALGRHYPDNYLPVRPPEDMPKVVRSLTQLLLSMRWIKYTRRLEGAIGRIPNGTRVVDVGCGRNDLLRRLSKARGCVGIGIDTKAEVVEYIRKVLSMQAIEGTLLTAGLQEQSADLVTMNEYLEHEPDPAPVLQEARRITRTGGHLVVEVPYSGGLVAKTMGKTWSQLDVPRHLVFYTPETLETMLARAGYKMIHVEPFGAPFSFGISVLQTLGFDKLGAMKGTDVLLIALAGTLFLPFFPILREFMFVVARAE